MRLRNIIISALSISIIIIAHASRFVSPGSVRIDSSLPESFPNVVFRTPEGRIVIIVLNDSDKDQPVRITRNNKMIEAFLKTGAVATIVW